MKNIIILMLSFVLVGGAHAYDWMSNIPNDKLIENINIPLSHDSLMWDDNMRNRGTMTNVFKFSATTQSSTLQEQLDAGIRGFDIRTYLEENKRNNQKNKIGIAHGDTSSWCESNLQLEAVLDIFNDFLVKHPTEYIYLVISIERDIGKNDEYVSEANRLLAKYSNRFIKYHENYKMSNVRGKMLIAYRDGKGKMKNGYSDPFKEYGLQNQYFKVIHNRQDYDFNFFLLKTFFLMREDNTYIEFNHPYCTQNGIYHGPKHYSEIINPMMLSFFKEYPDLTKLGLISLDFVGDNLDLVNYIFSHGK